MPRSSPTPANFDSTLFQPTMVFQGLAKIRWIFEDGKLVYYLGPSRVFNNFGSSTSSFTRTGRLDCKVEQAVLQNQAEVPYATAIQRLATIWILISEVNRS